MNKRQRSGLLNGLYWLTVAFLVVLIGLLSARVWAQRSPNKPKVHFTMDFAELRSRGIGGSA